jgi:23S rRNA pseudouridine1911/1915/1917 synthase
VSRSSRREVVPAALDGERVDRVVALLAGLPRSEVAELVDGGAVRLGGRAVRSRSTRVAEGDLVEVDVPDVMALAALEGDASIDVPVAYEDEHLLVVDKPAALVVHPGAGNATGTLVQGLLARYPELAGVGDPQRPGVVHRLDRGTSGLLLVARTPAAHAELTAALAARMISRRYLALAWGHVEPPRGTIDAPVGRAVGDPTRMAVSSSGRPARTHYELRRRFQAPVEVSELECRLETGRTHQIRVHLAAIGHPVVGDRRYGGERGAFPVARPFLHAWRLELDHPATGARLVVESPLPPELVAVLDGLR